MDSWQKDLANAHYFCILSDSSTDSSVIKEELVYLLFLKSGKPLLKFLSIELTNNPNAEGIIECIKTAFERIGILDFKKESWDSMLMVFPSILGCIMVFGY